MLPVQVWNARDGRRFRTERWRFRRGALLLTPGDSPAGLRLPLASLPWLAPEDYPEVVEQDPTVPRAPLPPPRLSAPEGQALPPTEVDAASGGFAVRTALVVEPRDGLLRVFLPPFETADDFVELTAALEDTARELDLSIRLEGYLPPSDPRIGMLQVTPDPGVIEVNVQPARSWAEVVRNTTAVYEEAEACGLAAEKFLVDGRHTGTGGGNHVVVGGPTPLDSPLLRRPDLLRSLIAYWINHPSLSYLFSGLFIGPTSQAPRADEARHDALRELELAFAKLPERGAECPPWLVDRLFRNLLVDVTGNTHRAEFCIDKLYSPDTAGGRRGLLELRAFEMPPHARMSAAQQLLLRALIARFWETPYRAALARWGTALQDRFTLPHFVWEDFRGVLEELRDAGFGFQDGWFEPHREFRFPVVGRIARGSLELELRQGLEPWHVLGEEGIVGGTARYVDSSLERLEVKVRGAAGDRYAIGCNGLRVPLAATGESGERVAGVRFRAWQPPRALHPTIGVHAPLRFDVVDTWNGRAVGGCAYHVSHPGGRSHEDFPVNAESAAGRRAARFLPFGHTPGALELREPPPNPEFPHTLDLRWAST